MTDVRWGILGTGGIAKVFTADLQQAGSTVTAVGSRSQNSADAFAAEHGIPNAHASYEALAADPEVDVIYVATPHPFHAANAILALEHGKHVLIEKAFTVNAAEAEAVARLGAERGLLVQEAMWTRFLPHMIRLREIVAAGTLGVVRSVLADHDQKLPSDPAHRLNDPALGGGALLDLAIYPVSFAVDVLGIPDRVVALSTPTPTGVDGADAIVLGFPGGAQALIHSDLAAAGPKTAAVIGTDARIEIDRTWYAPTTFRVIASDDTELERYESSIEGRGMQFQAFAVEAAIRDGRTETTELPASESVAIMRVLDEIRSQIGLRYPGE